MAEALHHIDSGACKRSIDFSSIIDSPFCPSPFGLQTRLEPTRVGAGDLLFVGQVISYKYKLPRVDIHSDVNALCRQGVLLRRNSAWRIQLWWALTPL